MRRVAPREVVYVYWGILERILLHYMIRRVRSVGQSIQMPGIEDVVRTWGRGEVEKDDPLASRVKRSIRGLGGTALIARIYITIAETARSASTSIPVLRCGHHYSETCTFNNCTPRRRLLAIKSVLAFTHSIAVSPAHRPRHNIRIYAISRNAFTPTHHCNTLQLLRAHHGRTICQCASSACISRRHLPRRSMVLQQAIRGRHTSSAEPKCTSPQPSANQPASTNVSANG